MSTSLIKVKDLTKIYGTEDGVKTKALVGANFEIIKGEFVAIMGPSGSGKSTLMQILGFLDRPTRGKYWFGNKKSSGFDEEQLAQIRNQKIGFVFQSFNLLPRTTVYENVELPLLYDGRRVNKKENRRRVEQALKNVMMEHRIDHYSNQLSGGEKQRVAIARALVNEPELVFADEPTGNLDSKSGLAVMRILQKLNESGKTIILVTHETYTAQHAKRILRFLDGELVKDEKVAKDKWRNANGVNKLIK